MRLPDVLTPRSIPRAELDALRLSGELYRLGPGWVPVDLPPTAELRAAVVGTMIGPRLHADRRTAAWIFGVLDTLPEPLQVCAAIDARAASRDPSLDIRELRLRAGDTIVLGNVGVTTPLRTAADLLRLERWDDSVVRAVAELLDRSDAVEGVLSMLDTDRRMAVGAARARQRLRSVVTRRNRENASPAPAQPALTR